MGAKQLPVAIERVRSQFEEWRAHKSVRERIPGSLWDAAVVAAQRHGVHAVSRAVGLEHSRLRRRVEGPAATGRGYGSACATGRRWTGLG